MDVNEFIKSIADAAPKVEQLQQVGFSYSEAEDFRSSFIALRRNSRSDIEPNLGKLGEIMSLYDISKIIIGMVSFYDIPLSISDKFIQFGKVEDDDLVYDTETGEIIVLERNNSNNIMWRCAKNVDSFQQAIVRINQFLSCCSWNESFAESETERNGCLVDCERLAGGFNYRNFYLMLLGM